MSSHRITHWIEIPIEIEFEFCPAERMTWDYPGCPEHIEIEGIYCGGKPLQIPDDILTQHEDEIEQACWDELEE